MNKSICMSFLAVLFLTGLSTVTSASDFNYSSYLKKFEEVEKKQNENFNNLRFHFSDKQIKKSATYKIVVRDQLGQDWLFKAGAHSSKDGAVALYRLYLLVGVDTPETYYKTFNINGETVSGAIQKVYSRKEEILPVTALNEKSQHYLAKNHALSWLTLNHHVHANQFIYLNTPENGLDVLRIDNSVNWFLFGHDQLSTFYSSPMLVHAPDTGYFSFWNDYLAYDVYKAGIAEKKAPLFDKQDLYLKILEKKKFNLDLNSLYGWILFIKDLPDNFYGSFYNDIVKNNFEYSANGSLNSAWFLAAEYMLDFDRAHFIENLIKRKNRAADDFKIFYSHLASAANKKVELNNSKLKEVQSELEMYLDKKLEEANTEKTQLAKIPLTEQAEIKSDISLSTHTIVSKVLLLPLTNDATERLRVIDEIKTELSQLPILKTKTAESAGIRNALKNLSILRKVAEHNQTQSKIFKMVLNYHLFFEKDGLAKKDKP